MNKTELRKMIREEVRKVVHDELPNIVDEQIYEVLPGFIKEALGSVVQKVARKTPVQQSPQPEPRRLVKEAVGGLPEDVRAKLREKMGYGDMDSMKVGESVMPESIAGVPMTGGLAQKEESYGQGGTRDYVIGPEGGAVISEGVSGAGAALETAPFAQMPDFLLNAVSKAKDVYDQAEQNDNWRPGKRK